MSNPPTARAFEQALDPSETLAFRAIVMQASAASTPAPLLLLGQGIASYSLALTPDAVACGLLIRQDGAFAPVLDDNLLIVRLSVDPSKQGSALFDGNGLTVGIEMTFVNTATPPDTQQCTFLVRIANK